MAPPITKDIQDAYDEYAAQAVNPVTGAPASANCPRLGYTSASEAVPAGSVVKEFRSKLTGLSTNRNFVKVYFSELVSVTEQGNLGAGAILIEAVYDRAKVVAGGSEATPLAEDDEAYTGSPHLGLKQVWLPKKLCSNLVCTPENAPLNSNTVEVWDVFLRDKYPELELPEE